MNLEDLSFWHWFVIAISLGVLEVIIAGSFFIWLGLAAVVVGLVLKVYPDITWQYQFIVFGVFSVVSITLWRLYALRHPEETDNPASIRSADQYIGRTFALVEPIVNGSGTIKVEDTEWRVRGVDAADGKLVKVVGSDAGELLVENA